MSSYFQYHSIQNIRGFENLGKNKTVTMHITFVSLGVVSTVFVKVQHYEVTDGILYL